MDRSANFTIVKADSEVLVIKDIGPWDQHLSVTNDAENVVKCLVKKGMLPPGRKLLYYDSSGQLDELVVKSGKFAGFRPGPKKEA